MSVIKTIFISLGLLCSALACAAPETASPPVGTAAVRDAQCDGYTNHGEKILCYIQYDYNNSATKRCDGKDSRPGFLCSGVIIRGTDSNINRTFYSWNPSPTSITSGGVSFSYLRKDSKFSKLAFGYVSGFIFYPVLYTPTDKDSDIKVLCGFPLDAATDLRNNKGCGSTSGYSTSIPCPEQGISTATDWYNKNYKVARDRSGYCGFVLYSSDYNESDQFMAMIDAMTLLGTVAFKEQNELRLATWAQNKPDLPIQAFFYISGSNTGLLSAQKDQKDFYGYFGEIVPVIEITMPATEQSDVKFAYNKSDQVME